MSDVYFNGVLIGTTVNGSDFAKKIIKSRREGIMTTLANVSYVKKEDTVQVVTERNRVRRPLIVVDAGKSKLTPEHIAQLTAGELKFSDLAQQGVIEYLDALEEESTLIAIDEKDLTAEHTHLELNPLAIFSPVTSLVPYANFNQSSRLNRGQKVQKQAMGTYALNYWIRTDTGANLLHYPQKSIVKSTSHDLVGENHSVGQNVVVAFMNYAYNMSDAIVLNKASVDRGLARSTYVKPYITQRLRYPGGQVDEIRIPDKDVKGYTMEKHYRFLGEDGLIIPEAKVSGGDVLIGKVSPPRFLGKMEAFSTSANIKKDASLRLKFGDKGIVNKVIVTEADDGSMLVKVEVRDNRPPEIGDKFSSRHSQKGIVGSIVPPEDLPFTASGIVPDVIFSPNGLVDRMTVSHIIEALGGKVGALAGRQVNGTPFASEKVNDLRKELSDLGFKDDGTEVLYDGRTGRKYEAQIFVGNMYYLRLKHQVADKVQSRTRGPVALLTRQPTEGRAREGGLRLGEMEKDTFVAHGSSLLMKERFDSDREVIWICERCGSVAIRDEYKNKSYCLCGEKTKVAPVEMAHAFKLFLDELKSLHIRPQLILKEKY